MKNNLYFENEDDNKIHYIVRRRTFVVRKKKDKTSLGRIYWAVGFRELVFEPQNDTYYAKGCLEEIVEFIKKLEDGVEE